MTLLHVRQLLLQQNCGYCSTSGSKRYIILLFCVDGQNDHFPVIKGVKPRQNVVLLFVDSQSSITCVFVEGTHAEI